MYRMLLAGAAVALSLTAPPAHAVDLFGGFSCGLTSITGAHDDPSLHTGVVTGGPWTVNNAGGGATDFVSLRCTVQINSDDPATGGVSRASYLAGNVGLLVDTISFNAQPGDDVYLCPFYEWLTNKGYKSWPPSVPPDPVECVLGTTVEGPPDAVLVSPSLHVGTAA